jgi:hypothetical protein
MWTLLLAAALTLTACGAGARGDDGDAGGADAALDREAHVSGTVWAPGNGPGQVAAGQEIPIADALIAASGDPPPDIPQQAYCDQCMEQAGGYSTHSDARGVFDLPLPPGTYHLIIQKGQFRREQLLEVGEREQLALTAVQSSLPAHHDPASGQWTPHLAVGIGASDDIQDVLGKMGLGGVSADGVLDAAMLGDHIDYYDDGGRVDITSGSLIALLSDLPRMKTYHVIFIGCTDTDGFSDLLFTSPVVRQNLRDYVAAGGKLYVTDWSAEWEDIAFPEFIQFASDADNTSRTCSGVCTGSGGDDPTCCSRGDGSSVAGDGYTSTTSKAVDQGLHDWLDGQMGPIYTADEAIGRGTMNADGFVIGGNWDRIQALPTVPLGLDMDGNPVSEIAKVWVSGDWGSESGGGGVHPLTVTFEPNGCGRVMYSTYHTADLSHPGLLPQERVLLYLILQIGECKSGPVIP